MAPWAHLWTAVSNTLHALFFSTFDEYGASQHPIGSKTYGLEGGINAQAQPGLFPPPGSNIPGFQCNYSGMPGWTSCQTETNKTCWLKNKDGSTFDIWTDYEQYTPIGIKRYYTLNVTNGTINVDGMNFTEAKLFNGQYPGPLIEACWGDQVHITVVNQLPMNGTSVHWHGIRQNQTMHMDGVNGITQCPIAPGDNFTYIWNATQYGTSWYHSHYSVQYADGAHAPITIHGPSISNYDVAIEPLIMTDWMHNSAFEVVYTFNPLYPSIVLNGAGNLNKFNKSMPVNPNDVPPPYEITFEPAPNPNATAKQYLIRLSNTAFSQGFIFSIDNHVLQIVEADFVPVKPFLKNSLLVALGQRYNLIVEAKPQASPCGGNPIPGDPNFWLRMWIACEFPTNASTLGANYSQIGILRYTNSKSDPTSLQWPEIPSQPPCVDDTYEYLVPVVNWTVGSPVNSGGIGNGEGFNITNVAGPAPGPYGTAFFYLQSSKNTTNSNPFATDYGNPTFLNLDNTADTWPIGWMVIPENYTAVDWVFLVIQSQIATHPMHLHGHDFAIIQESTFPFSPEIFAPKCDNPPRRDVVVVPNGGFVAIAFKTDNPGTWLMHCHIALHASSGLAFQIMERQAKANEIWPPLASNALTEARRVCANWNSWAYDCKNAWPGITGYLLDGTTPVYPACTNLTMIQNDSGI